MIPATLVEILESLDVQFAAVANLESGEIQFFGEQSAVGDTDLIRSLFADRETIESLNRSLDGQLLPRTWSQGSVSCVIFKPVKEMMVGLFVTDERSAIEQYRWAKQADEVIRTSFSGSMS